MIDYIFPIRLFCIVSILALIAIQPQSYFEIAKVLTTILIFVIITYVVIVFENLINQYQQK